MQRRSGLNLGFECQDYLRLLHLGILFYKVYRFKHPSIIITPGVPDEKTEYRGCSATSRLIFDGVWYQRLIYMMYCIAFCIWIIGLALVLRILIMAFRDEKGAVIEHISKN